MLYSQVPPIVYKSWTVLNKNWVTLLQCSIIASIPKIFIELYYPLGFWSPDESLWKMGIGLVIYSLGIALSGSILRLMLLSHDNKKINWHMMFEYKKYKHFMLRYFICTTFYISIDWLIMTIIDFVYYNNNFSSFFSLITENVLLQNVLIRGLQIIVLLAIAWLTIHIMYAIFDYLENRSHSILQSIKHGYKISKNMMWKIAAFYGLISMYFLIVCTFLLTLVSAANLMLIHTLPRVPVITNEIFDSFLANILLFVSLSMYKKLSK